MATTYSRYIKLSNFFGPQAASNDLYNSVTFFVTPEISEARSVSYIELSDIRLPASILIYMGSPSRTFSLNAKFIARSQAEADVSFRNKSLLESWCVTSSGLSGNLTKATAAAGTQVQLANGDATIPSDTSATNAQDGTANTKPAQATAPTQTFSSSTDLFSQSPKVLALEGYGGQFRKIPVVIQALNITYPSDVDYVTASGGQMVPILQDVSITLKEAREISGKFNGAISGFNLQAFKTGSLEYW